MAQPQPLVTPAPATADAGVLITMRDIYVVVIQLQGRVDILIEQHRTALDKLNDHEGRLRSLERGRWPLPALSVLIALAALVFAILRG